MYLNASGRKLILSGVLMLCGSICIFPLISYADGVVVATSLGVASIQNSSISINNLNQVTLTTDHSITLTRNGTSAKQVTFHFKNGYRQGDVANVLGVHNGTLTFPQGYVGAKSYPASGTTPLIGGPSTFAPNTYTGYAQTSYDDPGGGGLPNEIATNGYHEAKFTVNP